MILRKSEVLKLVRKELRLRFRDDFIFSTNNTLWDFVVYTKEYDIMYKVVYNQKELNLDSIKQFLNQNIRKDSIIKRQYYLVYFDSDYRFKFISI